MKRLISSFCLMLTVGAALTLVARPSEAVNLLANPGFETGGGSYTGWFTFGSGPHISTPGTDNIARTGVAASKIFGEFAGCPSSPTFSVGGYGQAFTPVVGQSYEFSGFSYVSSADPMLGTDACLKNRVLAKVVFFNAVSGGAELSSNEMVIGDGNTVINQWNAFSVAAVAPSGALRVEALILFLQPGCDAGSVFVDDLSLDASTPAPVSNILVNPSFSTNLAGWTTFGNVFRDARTFLLRSPAGSAKLFSTFTPDSPSGLFQAFPAARATAWELSAWSLNTCREDPIKATNDNYLAARIVFKNASSVEIGSEQVVLADKNSPLGKWTRHSVIALAPTGTASVEAYILFISPTLQGGALWVDDVAFYQLDPTGVPVEPGAPLAFNLGQNVPNPFNPVTRIDFEMKQADEVTLAIFDVTGRLVATLLQDRLEPGSHFVLWDGRTNDGGAAATGIYRYVMKTSTGQLSRSMVLIK